MGNELTFIFGGEQGEGIESVGEIFTKALSQMGFFLYGFRNFSSRIKGGHSDFNLRISGDERVYVNAEQVNVLIAFDPDTIQLYRHQLAADSVILYEPGKVKQDDFAGLRQDVTVLSVPFQEIARELGGAIMKNMVALGSACALLDQPLEVFEQAIRRNFAGKGDKIVSGNIQAFHKGQEFVKEKMPPFPAIRAAQGRTRLFLSGNEAFAIGAIAAGCRFMAGYPITPASEILENLVTMMPDYGGVVVQAEDELSSISMAIGASFAGARAMTATSGPGLSLMQEAIGLSGAVELPLVIIDNQRGGPSSGLATKQEQSDLNAILGGTHGEIPRIVISPSTVEEAMYDMNTAFNLAERYQCPVIIASDLVIATSRQTCEMVDPSRFMMDRGKRASEQDLLGYEEAVFKRYAFTHDHISARSIPGQKGGTHHVTGIEHGETGHPTENPWNRERMMIKRMKKIENVSIGEDVKILPGGENVDLAGADILFISFGSTYGAILEACRQLAALGVKAGMAHIRLLHPFPAAQIAALTTQAKKAVIVENNFTGQLAGLVKQYVSQHDKLHSCLKFNGSPFTPSEITVFCKELI